MLSEKAIFEERLFEHDFNILRNHFSIDDDDDDDDDDCFLKDFEGEDEDEDDGEEYDDAYGEKCDNCQKKYPINFRFCSKLSPIWKNWTKSGKKPLKEVETHINSDWVATINDDRKFKRLLKKYEPIFYSSTPVPLFDKAILKAPTEILRSAIHIPLSKMKKSDLFQKRKIDFDGTQYKTSIEAKSYLLSMYDSDIYFAILFLASRRKSHKILTTPKEIYSVFGEKISSSSLKSLRGSLDRQNKTKITISGKRKSQGRYHYKNEGKTLHLYKWDDTKKDFRTNSEIRIILPIEFVNLKSNHTLINISTRRKLSPVSKKLFDYLRSQNIESKSIQIGLIKLCEKVLFLETEQEIHRLKQLMKSSITELSEKTKIIDGKKSGVVKQDKGAYTVKFIGIPYAVDENKHQRTLYPDIVRRLKSEYKKQTNQPNYTFSEKDGSKLNQAANRIYKLFRDVQSDENLQDLYGFKKEDIKKPDVLIELMFEALNAYLNKKGKREEKEMTISIGHLCSNNTHEKVFPTFLKRRRKMD